MFKLPQENAQLIAKTIEIMKNKHFFKIWRSKINRIQNSDLIDREEFDLQEQQIKQKKNDQNLFFQAVTRIIKSALDTNLKPAKEIQMNVRFGDIIYLKFYVSGSNKAIIMGDGIASNRIECVPKVTDQGYVKDMMENPELGSELFTSQRYKSSDMGTRKCLFQINHAQKYVYRDQYEKISHQIEKFDRNNYNKKISEADTKFKGQLEIQLYEMKKKVELEKHENTRVQKHWFGQNIILGQEIQLYHIYSKCTVTLNINTLSQQNCGREISLEEKSSSWSNFKIIGQGGEPIGQNILYGDQIAFQNKNDLNYYIDVETIQEKNKESIQYQVAKGLEVHASDVKSILKICSYQDYQSYKEANTNSFKSSYLQNGDIIQLSNKKIGSYLSIKQERTDENRSFYIQEIIQERNILIELPNKKMKETKQKWIKFDNSNDKYLNDVFKVSIESHEDCKERILDTYWEVQFNESFNSSLPKYMQTYKFRNVISGLYLCQQTNEDSETPPTLGLTYNGSSDNCIFTINPKKKSNDETNICYEANVSLQKKIGHERYIIQCLEGQEDVGVDLLKKNEQPKDQKSNSLFVITNVDTQNEQIADRVSSLYPYLVDFYLFLQNFGMRKNLKKIQYRYAYAFEQQKQLYNTVTQLFESLQNLNQFLEEESEISSKTLLQKGVIDILMLILQQIEFMTEDLSRYQSQQKDQTPQKIVEIQVRDTVKRIYHILTKAVKGNHIVSNYLLQKSNDYTTFFLAQIDKYDELVSSLLLEAVRYQQQEPDTDDFDIKIWVDKLKRVKDSNLKQQTFFINLLQLSLNDPMENTLLSEQKKLRKALFPKEIIQRPINCMIKFQMPPQSKDESDEYVFPNIIFQGSIHQFMNENAKIYSLFSNLIDIQDNLVQGDDLIVSKQLISQSQLQFTQLKLQRQMDEIVLPIWLFNRKVQKEIQEGDVEKSEAFMYSYENYLISTILMYAAFCKDRNTKNINLLREIGLTSEYVVQTLNAINQQKSTLHLRLYKTFLYLYNILKMDVDPLLKIQNFTNRVFIETKIKDFQIVNQSSYIIFQKLTSDNNRAEQIVNDECQSDSISMQIQDNFVQDICPEKYIIISNQDINDELLVSYQLQALLIDLTIIKARINLGFNNYEQNILIQQVVFSIINALNEIFLKIQHSTKSNWLQSLNPQKHSNWLTRFLNSAFEICQDHIIYKKILRTILDIQNVIQHLRLNLQIIFQIQTGQNIQKKGTNIYQEKIKKLFKDDQYYQELIHMSNINAILPELINPLNAHTLDYYLLINTKDESMQKKTKLQFDKTLEHNLILQKHLNTVDFLSDSKQITLYNKLHGIIENNSNHNYKTPEQVYNLYIKFRKLVQIKDLSQEDLKNQRLIRSVTKIQQDDTIRGLVNTFQQFQNYIEELTKQMVSGKEDEQYKNISLSQNIIRNAGVHTYILETLKVRSKKQIDFFFVFYQKVITFLEVFIKDNILNKEEVLEYFDEIVLIGQLKVPEETLNSYSPFDSYQIKVHKLLTDLMLEIKLNFPEIKVYIIKLFKSIENNSPFYKINEENCINQEYQNWKKNSVKQKGKDVSYYMSINIHKSQNLIQLLKILGSLTSNSCNRVLQENQKIILNYILKSETLVYILEPMTPFYLDQLYMLFSTSPNEYHKLKIHTSIIYLITKCCKNNRLSIQEVQRSIMYDSLKNSILHKYSPYLLKRAYCQLIFEVYINQVKDKFKNMTIQTQSIVDFISSEIICQLEAKTFYFYLEGLVKKSKDLSNDQVWDIRKQIIQKKIQHFGKNKSFSAITAADQKALQYNDYSNPQQNIQRYKGIVKDPSEFWKYIMDEGVMHFVIDCYDEKKKDVQNEQNGNNPIREEFQSIQVNLTDLIEYLNQLEKDLRAKKEDLNLHIYQKLVSQIKNILPVSQQVKFGNKTKINKFDNGDINIDIAGEVSDNNQSSMHRQMLDEKHFQVMTGIRIFLLRNRIQIEDLNILIDQARINTEKIGGKVSIIETLNKFVFNKDKTYVSEADLIDLMRTFNEYQHETNEVIRKIELTKEFQLEIINKLQSHLSLQNEIVQEQGLKQREVQLTNLNTRNMRSPFQQMKEKFSDELILMNINIIKNFKKFKECIEYNTYNLKGYVNLKAKLANINILDDNDSEKFYMLEQFFDDEMNKYSAKESLYSIECAYDRRRVLVDVQIIQVILDFYRQGYFGKINNEIKYQYGKVMHFVQRSKQIFEKDPLTLTKIMKVFIQMNEADATDLEKSEEQTKENQYKQRLDNYKVIQNIMTKEEIDIHALSNLQSGCLNDKHWVESTIDNLQLIIQILQLGNTSSQNSILENLQQNKDLARNFFHFIREFFKIDMIDQLNEIKQIKAEYNSDPSDIRESRSIYEKIVLLILEMLQLFCENVNTSMQKFLRQQLPDEGGESKNQDEGNTNVVTLVSAFLTQLLEDSKYSLSIKSDILEQSFDTLDDFCSGDITNKKIICSDKLLFQYINEQIITKKLIFKTLSKEDLWYIDFKMDTWKNDQDRIKEEERQEALKKKYNDDKNNIQLFNQSIKFLLTLIEDNTDIDNLENIRNEISWDMLIILIKQIYDERIQPNLSNISLQISCQHFPQPEESIQDQIQDQYNKIKQGTKTTNYQLIKKKVLLDEQNYCSERYCKKNQVTKEDQLIIDTAFKIYILFNYIYRLYPSKCQNIKTVLLLRGTETEKKEQDDYEYEDDEENEQEQKVDIYQNEKDKRNFENKFAESQIGSIQSDEEATQLIPQQNMKAQLNKHKKKQQIVPQNSFNKALKQQNSIKPKQIQKSRRKTQACQLTDKDIQQQKKYMDRIHQYFTEDEIETKSKDIAQTLNKEKDKLNQYPKYKKFAMFYQKYLGMIEIVEENQQLALIYFQKPFICDYLGRPIKDHIQSADFSSDQQRLKYFVSFNQYYESWMKQKQLYERKSFLLLFLINNWRTLKTLSFFIVMTIVFIVVYYVDD